jgi:serine/threonine protein kinase/WD40 repeat protein
MTSEPKGTQDGAQSGGRMERVARLVDAWLERRAAGERSIDLGAFLEGHADVAGEVREQLGTIGRFDAAFSDSPAPPATLGDYRIGREIGRGGMGIVYEAEQASLGRRVALKVLPRQLFLSDRARRRFQLEARAAARLLHPNIVAVYDTGEHEGTLYYSMQRIEGRGLDAVLDALRRARLGESAPAASSDVFERADADSRGLARALLGGGMRLGVSGSPGERSGSDADAARAAIALPPSRESSSTLGVPPPSGGAGEGYFRRIAAIGVQVADALVYAHECGVVHRDIKPSNLLLGLDGSIRVADFGLAKTEGSEPLTMSGDVVGTIRYMSPERFRGWSDPRSDVYALGATLYELLTLRPLFAEDDRTALIHRILNVDPAAPRTVDPRIPRDLETIIRKAVEKDVGQRYQSAAELRDDLKRFLDGRPIVARRSSRAERGWLWCRRNPILAGLTAAVAVLLVVVAAVTSVMALRLDQKHQTAVGNLWQANLNLARSGRWGKDYFQSAVNLQALGEAAGLRVTPELRDEAVASLCMPRLELESTRALRSVGSFTYIDVDGPMEHYAAREDDGVVRVRRLADDAVAFELPRTFEGPTRVAFGPRGRFLATESPGRLEIWHRNDPGTVFSLPWCELLRTRFSPDERHFAVEVDERARIYDLDGKEPARRFAALGRYAAVFFPAAYPPGGTLRVLGLAPGGRALDLVDVDAGGDARTLRTFLHESRVVDAAYCAERRLVATANVGAGGGNTEFRAHVWDAESGDLRFELGPHRGAVVRAAFECGGRFVATHSWDGQSRIWETSSGRLLARDDGVHLSLAQGGGRGARIQHRSLSVLTLAPGSYHTLGASSADLAQGPNDVAFLPEADWLLSSGARGVKVWDVASARLLGVLEIGDTYSVCPDPRGGGFFSAGAAGVFWWPLVLRRADGGLPVQARFGPPEAIYDQDAVHAILDITSGGELLAFGHHGHAHVYRTGDRTEVFRAPNQPTLAHADISPNGRWLAVGNWNDKDVQIYDVAAGVRAASLPAFGSANGHFTPDSAQVIVSASSEYAFYSAGDWAPRRRLARGTNNMRGELEYSGDGAVLALLHSRRVLRLHDGAAGEALLSLETPDEEPLDSGLSLSADRRWLAAGSRMTRRIHVWDLAGIARRLEEIGIAHDLPPLAARDEADAVAAAAAGAAEAEVDLGILEASRWKERELARWTSAIREQPANAAAYRRRAPLFYALGRHQEALQDRERLLELEPDSVEAMEDLAWQHVVAPPALRDAARALGLARRAAAGAPAGAGHRTALAGALVRAGRHQEALEVLGDPGRRPGKIQGFDDLVAAMAQHHLGNPDAARAAHRRAAEWRRSQQGLHFAVEAELTALEAELDELLAAAAPAD